LRPNQPRVTERPLLREGGGNASEFFIGDDFTVGAAGEVWTIDTVRTWALVEKAPGRLFDKITLYGGLAGEPVPKEQAECACHGLTALKTGGSSGSLDLSVSAVPSAIAAAYEDHGKTFGLWQIEFRNLRWSVPGGAGVQFAIKMETPRAWFSYASSTNKPHRLRVFDNAGQLRSFITAAESTVNVQVWGRLLAKVGIRRAGRLIQVTVSGGPSFDVKQVDAASLRLDPRGAGARQSASPVRSEVQLTGGSADLVVTFRYADQHFAPGTATACLTGKRLDGVPFQGCDLLTHDKP
jgi:hypothetical protein